MDGANEVYSESHPISIDNNFGLYTLTIGKEASFKNIKWETGNKHIEVIAKFEGTPELKSPLIPLLTVPYAMYAAKSGSSVSFKNGPGIRLDFDAATQTYTLINTGDPDPADDITKTTQAGGDLTGIYPSPTIRDNAITNNKIAPGTISADKLQQSGATNGQFLRWDGAKWAPATGNTIPGPAYKAGLGIQIDATNTISNSAPDRTVTLKGEGGTTIKGQYPDFIINSSTVPGEKYTAGKGISITSSNVIENTGDADASDDVTKTMQAGGDITGTFADLQLKPGAVTGPEIGNNTITSDKIAPSAITGDKLNRNGAEQGQVLKWNGTIWAPAKDETSSGPSNPPPYTAGEGISISSNNVITNSKPDKDIKLTPGPGISVKGNYPEFTIESTNPPITLTGDNTTTDITQNKVSARNASPLWNANQLQGKAVDLSANLQNNYVLKWDQAANKWLPKQDETGPTTPNNGVSLVTATAPVTVSGTATAPVVGITLATATTDGALTRQDWQTFNNKEDKLTFNVPLRRAGNVITVENGIAHWNANKLQDRPIDLTGLQNGRFLQWNGTSWVPAEVQAVNSSLNGNPNFLLKFSTANSAVNSQVFDNGTNVGIGLTGTPITPLAKLHLNNGAFLANGNVGGTPISGEGTRLMWIPQLSAFRAGTVDVDNGFDGRSFWDNSEIGRYSVAMGRNNKAATSYSLAIGVSNRALGFADVAIGQRNLTDGSGAFALGSGNVVTKGASYGLGFENIVEGDLSIAIGSRNEVKSRLGTPIVSNYSAAHGVKNLVYQGNAFAFGTCVTVQHQGAFVLGDVSFDPFQEPEVAKARASDASKSWGDNTMTMRFDGGYRLYTSANGSSYAQLTKNSNSWQFVSDYRKKENFRSINGEEILNKIKHFTLTTWNYKGQDSKLYRHYGPMAQDFYKAFGNDGVGVIGTDTTIASADFEGINFTAIKALVDRTDELRQKDQQLDQKTKELDALLRQLNEQKAETQRLHTELLAQKEQAEKLQTDLELIKQHLGIGLQSHNSSSTEGVKK